MPSVKTDYGPGGGVRSVLSREGVDIGAPPDFWGDMAEIVRRLRPVQRAAPPAFRQASALREIPQIAAGGGPSYERPLAPAPQYDYEPTFATMVGQGPQSAGVAYQPYQPGMNFSPLNPPVATGYRMIRRG